MTFAENVVFAMVICWLKQVLFQNFLFTEGTFMWYDIM